MLTTMEIIKKIAEKNPDKTVHEIMSICEQIHKVSCTIEKIKKDLDEECHNHNIRHAKLVHDLTWARKDCKHELTTYYGDAAGGYDGFTECDICGEEVR